MNPLGTYNPANFSQQNPKVIDAGLPPAFIRIINSSPYGLYLSFGGMGDTVFPEMFLEDFAITKAFNGKITFYPISNIVNPSAALTNYLAINAFYPGELLQPQAQPLTTMSNLGNSVPLNATATSVANEGNPAGTSVVEGTPTGAGSSQLSITNDGKALFAKEMQVGTPGAGSNPPLPNLILAQNGGLSQCNIATDNPTGVAAAFALFAWNGAAYNQCLMCNADGSITGNLGTSYGGFSRFTGAASGTYNHGLGSTPSWCGPMQSVIGSQTMGFDSATSTQVHITSGSGNTFSCLCTKI